MCCGQKYFIMYVIMQFITTCSSAVAECDNNHIKPYVCMSSMQPCQAESTGIFIHRISSHVQQIVRSKPTLWVIQNTSRPYEGRSFEGPQNSLSELSWSLWLFGLCTTLVIHPSQLGSCQKFTSVYRTSPEQSKGKRIPYLDDAWVFEHLGCHFVLLDDQALDSLQFLAVLEPLNCRLRLGLTTNL